MKEYVLTEKMLNHIVTRAFKAGESWAVTYSTWWTPDEHEQKQEVDNAIGKAKRYLKRKEVT